MNKDDKKTQLIREQVQNFVNRDFNAIPNVLFEKACEVAHNEGKCASEVLELIDCDERLCPDCNESVTRDDKDEDAWVCKSCEETSESTDTPYEDLELRGAVHAWPGAHGTSFWTTHSRVKDFAADCGFLVYEPCDFPGIVLSIDGGGYDFFEAHWTPLYLALGLKWHEYTSEWKELRE